MKKAKSEVLKSLPAWKKLVVGVKHVETLLR